MKTAVPEHPSKSKSPTEFSKLKKLKITIMKSMKNFAAQQLSKKEMNNVKGGMELFYCTWGNGNSNYFTREQIVQIAIREETIRMSCVPA